MSDWGGAIDLAAWLLFIAFVSIGWRRFRARSRKIEPVPDGPEDEPYHVFTRQFDLELEGVDLERKLLSASPDYANGLITLGKQSWLDEISKASDLIWSGHALVHEALRGPKSLTNCALTVLVDQSGSMRDAPMRWIAVACRLVVEELTARGCAVEILGFSTAGWRGGLSYQLWKAQGRPKRPGRLCALLHVIYKSFEDEALKQKQWEAMLNPDALRENVDGEALAWAANRLRVLAADKKCLIVLSDGAPMDDATAMHNGLGFLTRHLRKTISDLETDASIKLSAVGIGCAVSDFYQSSSHVDELNGLPVALAKWVSAQLHLGQISDA